MSIPKSSSPANFNINNDNTREETTPRNTLNNIYNYNYSPPPSDELRQQQQALQINNTPEYIISSPQLFLSIKHISPPGTNSPSYSPVSNSSYPPYYFHHSTTTSTSPFPIRCQCLLCVEASTSGGDDSNRSSNYCQTEEKEKISSSLYKSQESTLLVYHHHDINDRSSSLGAFSPINMGGINEGECDIMLKSPSKRLRFSN
ncbi:1646_t:CDS:2 [Entrophospora sp. SA101]|nr:1646_t:CDS:2 [Entrophospora sp. SA101]CAJ0916099.1 3637_t:CDS:2 [Entrophospora sp. SA101]